MAVEVRKSMPQVAHTIHLKHPISPSAPGSIQWSIRRATIWLCYSPGNCLFPWCRCKPVYIGALRNPQNATWSSNHLGLELFAEVSTYPSWSRIFSRATARHLESWWRPFWVTLWCDVVHGQETPKYTCSRYFHYKYQIYWLTAPFSVMFHPKARFPFWVPQMTCLKKKVYHHYCHSRCSKTAFLGYLGAVSSSLHPAPSKRPALFGAWVAMHGLETASRYYSKCMY